jgi:predicted esterase
MLRFFFLFLCFLAPYACSVSKQGAPDASSLPVYSVDELQRRNFRYFWELADSVTCQVPDRYPTLTFSSIAATGFGLSSYLVGVEHGWITRQQAAARVLKTLNFLKNLPQGPGMSGVAGHHGFFYHFLDLKTALRYQQVELSSIDTGLLMAGILSCMSYFDQNIPEEKNIRDAADSLYRRVDWAWFMNEQHRISMGWFPDRGFLAADWRGYNEAMVLVLMAMGSPTHPLPADAWSKWCQPYFWDTYKDQQMVNFGPLFGHQYSHCWVDFRDIQDDYMRGKGSNYFENSRRATYANRQYCMENPMKWKGYGPDLWGLTACDGPQDVRKNGARHDIYNGQEVFFNGYGARGVAADYGFDDGTIAPTAAGGSAPFAPEICLPALENMWKTYGTRLLGPYGFKDAFNPSFTFDPSCPNGWFDVDYLGIDQGPIVLMLENQRTGLIWNIMRKNPYIIAGLKRAGFRGGWLDKAPYTGALETRDPQPNPEVPMEPAGLFRREIYQDATGHKLPYQLMEPGATGGRYPLVIFLHGSGEKGTDNAAQMRNGVYAFCEKTVREKHPCYFLVPQCPTESRWENAQDGPETVVMDDKAPTRPSAMVIELVEKMIKENPGIDPKRIYITGLSMGGYGTYDLLMRRPDLFAAGLPVCGGGDPRFADRIKNIPIWASHGRLDDSVFPKYDWQIVDALKKQGGNIKYTEYSTYGHDIWNVVYYNPAVMEWLFNQQK